MENSDTIVQAAQEYIARRDRKKNPRGEFDRGGRWYAAKEELRKCCRPIRSPSRRFPYSELLHCRTAKHVAHLFDVDEHELKRAARALDKEN
jgi:hypothetical protein